MRPELIESVFYYHMATHDDIYQYMATDYVYSIEQARVQCGYATVNNVYEKQLKDDMPSFLFSETLKYMYLLLDNTSPFRNMDFVFSTEAHPFSIDQLHSYFTSNEIKAVYSLYSNWKFRY